MSKTENKIPEPKTGIQRIFKAFFYSVDGLKHGIKNEAAVRQEVMLSFILVPLALLIPVSPLLKLILIICNLIVIITELLNSGIECVVDRLCPDYDPLAKQAKDMGSAAVFLSLVCLALSWLFAIYEILS
ncbi:Diacylglycerol kinase [Desulfonema limicola]|uniref:Diacylglycerol kinase n=1 Tax=Desulfonema limicola TaxID=45656 RepID=A0A975B6S2_9BACT|nr:diacylglycerol kinase [Desulfonema limicola]QTA79852.1 Diacylglycerol kinase [Desulfonema limicola]